MKLTLSIDVRNPLSDFAPPPGPIWGAAKLLAAVVVLVGVSIALEGCLPPRGAEAAAGSAANVTEAASLKAKLKACREENATCEGYVACRRRVEAEHGIVYKGRCDR